MRSGVTWGEVGEDERELELELELGIEFERLCCFFGDRLDSQRRAGTDRFEVMFRGAIEWGRRISEGLSRDADEHGVSWGMSKLFRSPMGDSIG